ncbi:UNVERIFIED_CONTAM: hypothetical protein K2H54_049600 [Gekko kuhli]
MALRSEQSLAQEERDSERSLLAGVEVDNVDFDACCLEGGRPLSDANFTLQGVADTERAVDIKGGGIDFEGFRGASEDIVNGTGGANTNSQSATLSLATLFLRVWLENFAQCKQASR